MLVLAPNYAFCGKRFTLVIVGTLVAVAILLSPYQSTWSLCSFLFNTNLFVDSTLSWSLVRFDSSAWTVVTLHLTDQSSLLWRSCLVMRLRVDLSKLLSSPFLYPFDTSSSTKLNTFILSCIRRSLSSSSIGSVLVLALSLDALLLLLYYPSCAVDDDDTIRKRVLVSCTLQ